MCQADCIGHNNVNMVNVNKKNCEKLDKEDLDSLGIVLLNICGLKSKLKQYEFEEYIQKYKLIFLTETKLNCLDDITIPDYKIIVNNRKGARKSSGGVAILVHKSIEKCITRLDNEINETLWIKFSNSQNSKPVIFSLVYNPPSDSPYADPTVFDMIDFKTLLLS